jgi:hypothetical protein
VANALDKASITANKNGIPFDQKSPFVTSGVRLGTPAVTTRGMKENDMKTIAGFIKAVTENMEDEAKLAEIREEVIAFSNQFVLPETARTTGRPKSSAPQGVELFSYRSKLALPSADPMSHQHQQTANPD